jgi:AcrR family transcriptional regulator
MVAAIEGGPMARRRRDDYYEAALEILEEKGFPALTASALCDTMNITRGAFYHHFDNFDEFVDGLLAFWELHYSHELINESVAIEDFAAMLKRETEMVSSLRHGAEVAIRAWGATDARVASAQRRVDRVRHDGLRIAFERHNIPAAASVLYADLALNTLIGAQMRGASRRQVKALFGNLSQLILATVQADIFQQ